MDQLFDRLEHLLPYYKEDGWRPSSVPYLEAVLVFITLVYVFETYLDFRQHQKLKDDEFPPALRATLEELGSYKSPDADADDGAEEEPSLLEATLAKFDKSRQYGLDKSTFGFIQGAYTQLESTGLLLLGYLPFMWTVSGRVLEHFGLDAAEHEIYRSLVLITLSLVRDSLVKLPFSLYSTFVIEARHGFNNQTLTLYFTDLVKSFVLALALWYPLTAVLIYLVRWGGELFYVYVWVLLFAFTLVMIVLYPVVIMPLFNTFTELEAGALRSRIEALASRLEFPLTQLFVVDGSKRSSHSNAYFFGLFKNKRIVLFDTLLKQANEDEIEAIVGHELGHWKKAHIYQMMVIQEVYKFALFFVFGLCMHDSELFASFGFESESKPVIVGLLLFLESVWAPVDHLLSFLMTLNTRKNEFQADAFSVGLGHAPALKTGLTKLAIENLSNMNPDSLYSAYHYSHPPLVERLRAISEEAKKRE